MSIPLTNAAWACIIGNDLRCSEFGVKRNPQYEIGSKLFVAIGKVCFTESPRRQDTAPTCENAGSSFCRGAAQADPFEYTREREYPPFAFSFTLFPRPNIFHLFNNFLPIPPFCVCQIQTTVV